MLGYLFGLREPHILAMTVDDLTRYIRFAESVQATGGGGGVRS
jgi:hypothetical protein